MSLVFRETNLFTAAASVCGVTLEPTRPTPPSVCAPTDRTLPDPPSGLRSSAAVDRTRGPRSVCAGRSTRKLGLLLFTTR